MYVPGLPYHVYQRGNNRSDCFFDAEDRDYYLSFLYQASRLYGVSLHAYVLMTNHVHLLLTPVSVDSVSRMTRVLGSRYAQYVNEKYRRTGSLWEGRHKSCPIDTATYLLKCYRYIELNPVRAQMVQAPGQYAWSSYAANALAKHNALLSPHQIYLNLGATMEERCSTYCELVHEALDNKDLMAIRSATDCCFPLGGESFCNALMEQLGVSIGHQTRGRPRKSGRENG